MFKGFPFNTMNFKISSWDLSQYISTITFIIISLIFKGQIFGSFTNFTVKFTTPLGVLALIALFVAQLYTYGVYFVNSANNIVYPLIVIGVVFVVDTALSFILTKIGYVMEWKQYLIRYALMALQCLVLMWVYNRVEFIEIPKADLGIE